MALGWIDSFWQERGWVPSELLVLAAGRAESPEQALHRSHFAHLTLAFAAMCGRPIDALRTTIVDVFETCDVRAHLPDSTLLVLDLLCMPRVAITAAMRTKTFPAVLGATDKPAKLAASALDEAVRVLEEQSRGVPGGPLRGLLATMTLAAAARISEVFALGANISAHHVLEFADASLRRREGWPALATHPHVEKWPLETGEALVDALQIVNPIAQRRLTRDCGA